MTLNQLKALLQKANNGNAQTRAKAQVEIINAIPGMTEKRPASGPVSAKMDQVESFYVAQSQAGKLWKEETAEELYRLIYG